MINIIIITTPDGGEIECWGIEDAQQHFERIYPNGKPLAIVGEKVFSGALIVGRVESRAERRNDDENH